MPTKNTPTKQKKVKAWAIVNRGKIQQLASSNYPASTLLVFSEELDAYELEDVSWMGDKLIPVTITYSVPTKRTPLP